MDKSNKKTAVIIKGNPQLILNNTRADDFYNQLKSFLEDLGFTVSFDSGEPYTVPPEADLWIGHSRGADRLRFASPDTRIIGIGVPEIAERDTFPIVNHPEDELAHCVFKSGKIVEGKDTVGLDDTYHYVLTEEMKEKIAGIIKRGKS